MTVAGVTNGHGRLVSFLSIFAQSRPKTGRLLAPKGRRARAAVRRKGESSRWRECCDEASTRGRPRRQIGCGDQGDAERRLVIFVAIFFFSARNVIRRTVSAGRVCDKARARSSRE